jgi:hypothetical protein
MGHAGKLAPPKTKGKYLLTMTDPFTTDPSWCWRKTRCFEPSTRYCLRFTRSLYLANFENQLKLLQWRCPVNIFLQDFPGFEVRLLKTGRAKNITTGNQT